MPRKWQRYSLYVYCRCRSCKRSFPKLFQICFLCDLDLDLGITRPFCSFFFRPVKASQAVMNLSSPQKIAEETKEPEQQALSPKEKTPRGRAEEPLPEEPPALRESRPREPEVTMMPPPEEAPRRSARKVMLSLLTYFCPIKPFQIHTSHKASS
jgi:hypothetical protein